MDNINKLIVEKGAAPYDSVKNAFALDFIQTPLSPNIDAKLYAYVEYLQYLRGIVQMEPGKDETVMNYNLRMLREAHKQGSLKNVTLKK